MERDEERREAKAVASGDAVAVGALRDDVVIFSHGRNAMSLFDAQGRILDVNDAWVTLYGYSREEARTMNVQQVSAEPDVTREAIRKSAEETGGAHISVRWHKKRDGTVFPVELTAGTLRIGERVLMYAVMVEIADALRIQAELRQSEARFRALTESLPVGVLVHKSGQVLYMNPALKAMLGATSDAEVVGSDLYSWVHPEDRAAVVGRVRALVDGGTAAPLAEERILRRDGSHLWAEISAINIEYDGGSAALAMVRDIHDRKQMEAQLVLADRLASLGRLAASVGHEINNPLAYLVGTIEILRRDVHSVDGLTAEARTALGARLDVLDDAAFRVRDIVRDLKSLSSGDQTTDGPPIDLHRVLDVAANMAEHALQKRARLVRQYGLPVLVRAAEGRIGQIFLNLLVNAGQALEADPAPDNEVRLVTRRVDDGELHRAIIEVTDTGPGIAPGIVDRIFEPFFTTKGKTGTGLGLSICHSLVTSLGGTIEVEANTPRGTRFRVTLPCEPQ